MAKRLIIILGYTLNEDGTIKSILKFRLDRALSIYQPTDTLLVCGKYTPKALISRRCEHTTEAEAMQQYLMAHGVAPENILKEEESATTFGNALFSCLNILNNSKEHYQQIIVVSNEFHEPLVQYCFDKVLGDHYSYVFSAVPDEILDTTIEELEQWRNIIAKLVDECYPLLFSDIENGDIAAIQSVITSSKHDSFASSVKNLLNLDDSVDIVIASEAETQSVASALRI